MSVPASQGLEPRDIARMVPIRRALSHFGWQIRSRGRADCGLCRGKSKGTVSFTEQLWKCHRCNEGGGEFELVRCVNKCGFREALHYVADLAGVRFADSNRSDPKRQRHQARLDTAADILAEMERALRLDCREQLQLVEHHLDALSAKRTWTERDWLIAAACYDMQQSALPAYVLLAFGAIADRSRYILQPKRRREMEAGIRLAGGLGDENGLWVEVLE